MTISEVRVAAQNMLQDNDTTRWDVSTLDGYAALAEKRAYELRPDLWVSASGVVSFPTIPYGTDIIPDILEALAHYVAFLALSEDDADRGNAAGAAEHLGLFRKLLQGG